MKNGLRWRRWLAIGVAVVGAGLLLQALSAYDPAVATFDDPERGPLPIWRGVDLGRAAVGAVVGAVGSAMALVLGRRIRQEGKDGAA